jgi:molybdenum-dependent DNA-binding transcriptional regulator ModE
MITQTYGRKEVRGVAENLLRKIRGGGGGGGRVTEIFKTYINTFWKRTMHIYSYFHQFNAQLPFPLIILSKVGPTFTYKLSDTSLYRSWGKRINTFK